MEQKQINLINKKPIFKNLPILCPWISCQPYPSSQLLKNKLTDLVKKHGAALNNTASTNLAISEKLAHNINNQQSSSTHFFYFLRLMQLFPDTHPATLHTVLTLSKCNFFVAIDKLLYAQKCKGDLKRKLNSFNGKGQSFPAGNRTRHSYPKGLANQRFTQSAHHTNSIDLAEVQRIIEMSEKPYLEPTEETQINSESEFPNSNQQDVNICVDNPDQLIEDPQTFVETDNHEVIEIVCFDNEQTVLKQPQYGDSMEIEAFGENVENIVLTMDNRLGVHMENNQEPPVIIVDTMHDSDDAECINQDIGTDPMTCNMKIFGDQQKLFMK
ncbi:hypothetical protein ABEB36_005413 [Hypothenemus hampei]|uniref:Uncharacterized protein n=1 Tax=Hypothenemus hampei TaxID=57062 RepID=A0ABD1F170_HYPHA